MKVGGKDYKTVWMSGSTVFMINQLKLPFSFEVFESRSCNETARAIKDMVVRGAGAIGAAAGYAMAQAFLEGKPDEGRTVIEATRPTAVDLFKAVKRVYGAGADGAVEEAKHVALENEEAGRKIGEFGEPLVESGSMVETHCNAGWLAFVDWGSALAPVYRAHRNGKKVKVIVDETRPRLQGARLTSWELKNEGIEHFIACDGAAAHHLSKGMVGLVVVGADRIAANGDTANKIGTLGLAIAAERYGVPFYVAAPSSTVDFSCARGELIPIEERSEDEVLFLGGVRTACGGAKALNPAFDVTPAGLVKGIITEKGVLKPSGLNKLK